MTSTDQETFDAVVVGGGPGGSTVATLVAQQGHRVLLLEKETFPRYQIGESLLPSTIHGIGALLGVTDEIEKAGFMRKRGGTFRWGANPEPWSFSFAISPRIAGPTSHAYQVERMKFDQILLDNARRKGVEVREQCAAVEVIEDGGRVQGLVYTGPDGTRRSVRSAFVVDASGNKSRLHQGVGGERVYSDFFQNIALFGYFTGGDRLPEPNRGNIFCAAFDEGWFWYIPLTDDLTSVGAVINRESASEAQGDPRQALARLIDRCEPIRDLLKNSAGVTEGPYGQVRVRKDYSYLNTRFWRPGMVLVGDAACFVDPVFSSGVHLATYSAMLAARSINTALDGLVDEERSFQEYEARYRHEYGLFYEFLMSFYDMNADNTSYYWQAKKVTRCADSELESFVGLVGGVASGESAVLGAESLRAKLAATSGELAQSVAAVGAAATADDATPLFQSSIVSEVMREGARTQARAQFGEAFGDAGPMFPGGLMPTSDGTRWTAADAQ
ncbi:tryptophan 7-halogenase [Kitasatospora aureofaciens]|uniref:tryptophan 7-halogenase n=1 Tax=Kitasatospora aureofaciens TaxID=1894 RepID=UPI0033FB9B4F